jgi:hypothetical protein
MDKKAVVMMQHAANIELERQVISMNRITLEQNRRITAENWSGIKESVGYFVKAVGKIVLVLIVFVFIFYINNKSKPKSEPVATPAPVKAATAPVATPVPAKPAPAPAPVDTTLPTIRETLRRIYRVDMDNDGKINCIDYTIQFYQYYPNRNVVRIIWSDNKNFNHLFVRVNGIDVEPGAYLRESNTEKWFGMKKFWGDRYDPSYNRDITSDYESIRDGTRWR